MNETLKTPEEVNAKIVTQPAVEENKVLSWLVSFNLLVSCIIFFFWFFGIAFSGTYFWLYSIAGVAIFGSMYETTVLRNKNPGWAFLFSCVPILILVIVWSISTNFS